MGAYANHARTWVRGMNRLKRAQTEAEREAANRLVQAGFDGMVNTDPIDREDREIEAFFSAIDAAKDENL